MALNINLEPVHFALSDLISQHGQGDGGHYHLTHCGTTTLTHMRGGHTLHYRAEACFRKHRKRDLSGLIGNRRLNHHIASARLA